MQSDSTPKKLARSIRIDTDHCVHEMMQRAVDRMPQASVKVQMSRDTVLLTGSVNRWQDKQLAQEAVRAISRTRTIRNELQVHST
ncbi:MAG: BON domain-containing protein [Fuerstiella sp.]|nr:BON domain-containing protein [Fuerstiella sp.]